MKKNILLLLSFFILASFEKGQAQTYIFSTTTSTYTALTGATKISSDLWDDEIFTISMPFSFNFYDGTFSTLYVTDGKAMFNNPGYEMYVCNADLIDLGTSSTLSPVSYLVTGTTPNRILKVEWKNVGFYGNTAHTDNANFQLWLYEGSAKLEYHYGAINVTDGADSWDTGTGPSAAIINSDGSNETFLTGSPSSPTVNANTSNGLYLTGAPATGTVYVFTRNTASGITYNTMNVENSIYPNPFNNVINLENDLFSKESEIRITDVTGKPIYEANISKSKSEINTEAFPSGIYFIEIISDGKIGRKKLIKK